ncbi:uncharacterized protein RMCC_0579 [Mycolicibacterium canariasense]|uniref:UspA domain-containing protein n=1 Tax=Mycolicibacterium canariasense TaxID=228230 RepID=A0A100W8T7_MYCCR|nr:universal stress protein [Mycolicibacterium canariasense]MCV7213346.1 universal stress protein [Mycolicibacterium canariasense]ORV10593.1 hypothetical protein AWB94_06710 [Mycolicibacterium canariasense]GAS93613.1 uncharacterized protein RMCC_0579 [Mycolicibacterium canariasense]
MRRRSGNPPVVVGIDGSDAAVNAALWGVDEAIRRDAPLRLVYVVDDERLPGTVHADTQIENESAERALQHAVEAIAATGKPVSTYPVVRRGHSAAALIAESRDAALVCVGSTGIDWVAGKVLGSTAESVAEHADCPVAVVRHDDAVTTNRNGGVIVVGFRRAQRDDAVFRAALDEARNRHAPLIAVGVWQDDFGKTPYTALEQCVEQWTHRYPDVHVYPVPTLADLPRFLADNADGQIQLAVLGADDADKVATIIGPQSYSPLPHGRCSVLVVR